MAGELTVNQRQLAESIATNNVLRFGIFLLKGGAESPVYLDLQLLQRFPRGIKPFAVDAFAGLLEGLHADLLAPVPVAAIAIVSSVSDRTGIPMITPRLDKKPHGTHTSVEVPIDGILPTDRGSKVALLDDVVSTAGSKLEVIKPLEAVGLEVRDVVVLLDRETGGREQLADKGYLLHSALTLRGTLVHLHGVGLVTSQHYEQSMNFLEGRPWR